MCIALCVNASEKYPYNYQNPELGFSDDKPTLKLDTFISSIVPKRRRASGDTRALADEAKEMMDIKKFVLICNAKLNDADDKWSGHTFATTYNFSLISLMLIDEKELEPGWPREKIHTVYHEMDHVLQDDGRMYNDTVITAFALGLYASSKINAKLLPNLKLPGKCALSTTVISAPLFLVLKYMKPDAVEKKPEEELRADVHAAFYMAKAGYINELTAELMWLKKSRQELGGQYLKSHETHCTINESIKLTYDALKSVNQHQTFEHDPDVQAAIAELSS